MPVFDSAQGEPSDAPLVINFAPTGIVPTRAMSAHVPLQPDEIVRDVVAAAARGAAIAHLHARDESGQPTNSPEVYGRIIAGIRERVPELLVCVSCSGRRTRSLEERAAVLDLPDDLKPDMASLTLSSLNFSREPSINSPEDVRALAQRMLDRGIVPELEVFDIGMVNVLRYLTDRGLLRAPLYANLLFGNLATAQADLLEIATLVSRLPSGVTWGVAGLGAAQLPVTALGVAFAPAVRIGLEDNLWLDRARTHPATNLDLVDRTLRLADAIGRPIMSPGQLRRHLALPRR
jgi:3-keto-5-aminohexanoate cleavage enzyme